MRQWKLRGEWWWRIGEEWRWSEKSEDSSEDDDNEARKCL